MKRFLPVLAAILAVGLITGCGSNTNPTTASGSGTQNQNPGTATAGGAEPGDAPERQPGLLAGPEDSGTGVAMPAEASKERAEAIAKEGSTKPAATKPEGITGKWYGEFDEKDIEKLKKQPGGQNIAAIAAMRPDLELKANGKFTMTFFGNPLEGSYTRKGDAISLKCETFMGMKLSDPSMKSNPMFAQFAEPMDGKVQKNGTVLFFPKKNDEPNEIDLRFTRNAPAGAKVGAKSVSAAEAKYVGEYAMDDSRQPKPENMTKAQESAFKMMQAMMKGFKLSLREDNTFSMTMMLTFTGNWKLDGDTIKMNVTGPKEIVDQMPPDQTREALIKVKPNGVFAMLNEKDGSESGYLKKIK